MDKIRAHRELLKQQLFNYDYSNVSVDKNILVELDYGHITVKVKVQMDLVIGKVLLVMKKV